MTVALECVNVQQHAPPYFIPRKDPVPIVQEAGWDPGPVWTGRESHRTGNRSPDRPARNSVTIPTELPGPKIPQDVATQNKEY